MFALLQFFLHLGDLALVDYIRIGQLSTLLLQRGDQALCLLNQRLFVFDFALERLDQHHLLRDRLLLRILRLIKCLITLS